MAKVLFIINDLKNLSLNNTILKLGIRLKKNEFTPYVFALSPEGELKEKFSHFFKFRLFIFSKYFIKNIISLIKLIKNENFDLIDTQTLKADYAIFIAKLVLGSRCRCFHIANRRNYLFLNCETKFWLKNIFYFFSCRVADMNICCSQHLGEKLIHRLKVPRYKVMVISNGVKPIKVQSKTNSFPLSITFTGQLVKRKNLIFLLKALTQVKSDYLCRIIGSGSEKKTLSVFIKSHGLARRVKLIPSVIDVYPYLKSTNIFVLPSLSEGMSLSLLEAMSFGIACAASDIDANREVISDNKDGVLFPLSGNPFYLAKILEELITNSELRRRLGENSRKKIAQLFDENRMYTEFINTFTKLYHQQISRNLIQA